MSEGSVLFFANSNAANSCGLTINELARQANRMAVDKGFWERIPSDPLPTKLALIHSEISEALEAYRNNLPFETVINGKPEGIGVEIADAVIRLCDLAGHYGLDLEGIILRKMAYNESRPFKHGGKRC
jgi:NTP pyrophosphatase (non-canonical NTP hydrolase)